MNVLIFRVSPIKNLSNLAFEKLIFFCSLKNNEKILHLEFNDLDFKNKFEYYNSALNSSSIHI